MVEANCEFMTVTILLGYVIFFNILLCCSLEGELEVLRERERKETWETLN